MPLMRYIRYVLSVLCRLNATVFYIVNKDQYYGSGSHSVRNLSASNLSVKTAIQCEQNINTTWIWFTACGDTWCPGTGDWAKPPRLETEEAGSRKLDVTDINPLSALVLYAAKPAPSSSSLSLGSCLMSVISHDGWTAPLLAGFNLWLPENIMLNQP